MDNQLELLLTWILFLSRFRPMDNLSGGEKTVAALALLFAVQRLLGYLDCTTMLLHSELTLIHLQLSTSPFLCFG